MNFAGVGIMGRRRGGSRGIRRGSGGKDGECGSDFGFGGGAEVVFCGEGRGRGQGWVRR